VTDSRSLSPLQKQLMKAFAEDAEGGKPEVHFGPSPSDSKGTTSSQSSPRSPPPPSSSSYSSPNASSSSFTRPSASSRSSPQSEPLEPEYRSPPVAEGDGGLLGKVASAVGGVLGWADKLFGNGKGKK
jgi:molecular chaperone DnaJ